jgi:hypothetical protein
VSQVSSRIVVDICDERIDIEDGDGDTRIAFRNQELEGCAVREDLVYEFSVLFHFAAHFGYVCWLFLLSVFIGDDMEMRLPCPALGNGEVSTCFIRNIWTIFSQGVSQVSLPSRHMLE